MLTLTEPARIPSPDYGPVIAGQGTIALELLEQARARGRGVCLHTRAILAPLPPCTHAHMHIRSRAASRPLRRRAHRPNPRRGRQVPGLDAIIVPISGGGMISGIALAAKALRPSIKVIAAEPSGSNAAADAAASKAARQLVGGMPKPKTIADGLQARLGALTWPVVRDLVDEVQWGGGRACAPPGKRFSRACCSAAAPCAAATSVLY